ncbi:hypothetical protein EHQ58_12920 [Leptospira ognonensis]|uniref:Uncharacterized protein n=1 Tax=Leptospira ognonensis TaxID=2484945 RepID=A0A4R9JXJ7_9LEPT|nr:hypothetical protein [Leptospira ognonensis]TGL57202.1 hypothetical protein EHQ58_12920 [Leptospira ognonensis]
MDFLFFYLAVISYFSFFVISICVRIGKSDSPLAAFNRLHFRMTLFYIMISYYCISHFALNVELIFWDFFIGLFLYFSFHYSIFLNFYALAQRSISSSLLILLSESDGVLSQKEILERYANGKGFKYIKESRIEDLTKLDWLLDTNGDYTITRKGKLVIQIVKSILAFWGLVQLGKSK